MIVTTKNKCGTCCLLLSCCLMLLTTRLIVEGAEENLRRGGIGVEKKDPTAPVPLRGYPGPFSIAEKEALKKASLAVRTGFVPNLGGNFELLSFNTGGQIFDGTKIQKYLETDFNPYPKKDGTEASQTSFETMTREIETEMELTGSYNSLSGTFEANVGVEVGVRSRLEKETVLYYKRDGYHFGYLDLPYHYNDKSTLQALMDPIALSSLQGISSLSEAENMVNTYGIGYFHRTYYGAVFKLSSTIEKKSWFDSTDVQAAVGASYSNLKGDSVNGQITSRVSVSKGGRSASMNVDHIAIGGDPTLLTDYSAWRESTKKNPVVTTFSVRPLYELLSPTKDSRARGFLETAVNEYIGNYKGTIPSLQPLPWVPLNWNYGPHHESNWFSEEHGGYSDFANGPIFNMLCGGGRCDNKKFQWMVYRGRIDIFKDNGDWSGWFSEEQGGNTCPNGKAVRQIQCGNSQCDNMRIRCAGLKDNFRVNNAATSRSNWFSEENGWHYCGGRGIYFQTHWIIGLGCRGSRCDDVQLRCALIEGRGLSSSFSIEDEPSLEALPAKDIIA